MHFDQNPNTLAAYLDGELPPQELSSLQEHIEACPRCAAEIAEFVSLRRSLRSARNHFSPSAELRQRVQKQIAPQKVQSKPRFFLPMALALAAMLLLSIGTIGLVYHSSRAAVFGSIADLHVNALASSNPLDVVSTDRHTVKPWFQGRIPFSFNVPELAGTQFTLLGGRLVYLHQQPGAQLIVSLRQHKISVLIFQASSIPSGESFFPQGVTHRNSFNVDAWQSQNLRFFVIGDADVSEIRNLSDLLKHANE
jgi:anti-sigma factor RsiW